MRYDFVNDSSGQSDAPKKKGARKSKNPVGNKDPKNDPPKKVLMHRFQLLDISGSMAENNKWKSALASLSASAEVGSFDVNRFFVFSGQVGFAEVSKSDLRVNNFAIEPKGTTPLNRALIGMCEKVLEYQSKDPKSGTKSFLFEVYTDGDYTDPSLLSEAISKVQNTPDLTVIFVCPESCRSRILKVYPFASEGNIRIFDNTGSGLEKAALDVTHRYTGYEAAVRSGNTVLTDFFKL